MGINPAQDSKLAFHSLLKMQCVGDAELERMQSLQMQSAWGCGPVTVTISPSSVHSRTNLNFSVEELCFTCSSKRRVLFGDENNVF